MDFQHGGGRHPGHHDGGWGHPHGSFHGQFHGHCDGDDVFPPGSTVAGLNLEEWTARWWTSVVQSDYGHNIVIGADPADAELGDTGRVHMLGGLFIPGTSGDLGGITRSFEVDRGDAILVPVLNAVDIQGSPALGTPPGADPVAVLNANIDAWIASIDWNNTHLFVDGEEIDLAPHLHRTDVYSMGTVAEGTVADDGLGAPVGESMELSMAAGIMVMLEPLPRGQHDISWEGTAGSFHYEVHDIITVA